MIPSAMTAQWPTYKLGATYPSSFAVNGMNERLVELTRFDPHMAFLSYAVGNTEANLASTLTFGFFGEPPRPATMRYKSDLGPAAAQELASSYLQRANPGAFSNFTNALEALGAQVVVPTIVEAAAKGEAAVKGATGALPWVAVAAVAVAVIYGVSVFRGAR
jgi:hypothetical protein